MVPYSKRNFPKMRTYKRRVGTHRYTDYDSESIEQALQDIISGKLTLRQAADKYDVPKSTLGRKTRGQQVGHFGHPMVFSAKEKHTVVQHLCTVSNWGFRMDSFDLQMLAVIWIRQVAKWLHSTKISQVQTALSHS